MRDYVEWSQITFGSRRIGFNRAHHNAFIGAFKQIAKVRVVTEGLDPDAQPGSHDFVTGDQFGANFFGHITGNCETKAAIHPVNQRVHADHLAVDVTEWTAAIARINRRVRLQIIGDGIGACLKQFAPAFTADHAVSKSVIELEWRTDRKCKLAHPHRITVPQLDHGQIFRIDLDDRDISLLIRPYDPPRKIPAVLQFYVYLVCAFDNMKVREDVTVWPDNKAGAFALDRSWRARGLALIAVIGWSLKEQVIERRAFGDVIFLGNLYNHNTRRDGFEDFCKSIVQLMNDIFACLGHSGRNSRCRNSLRLRGQRCTECNAQGQNG